MNLVPKLSLAFITGTSVILGVNGYLRVQREVALFEHDRIRDDVLIGTTIASTVANLWQTEGPARALETVDRIPETRVHVRWIWLDGPNVPPVTGDRSALRALAPSETLTRTGLDEAKVERRFTFVPVAIPDPRGGAIEVSETLTAEHAYIRRTILDSVGTMAVRDLFCAILAMILGTWLVGRPIRALTDKARRVGGGEFAGHIRLAAKDELGALAGEMNAMSDRLIDANDRAAHEARARAEMLDQLRHADRLMTVGKLASGVAHELGTPLNVVEARAAMIADGDGTPEEMAEYSGIIVHAAKQMTRIIRQLLAFARPQAARKAPCDLTPCALRTIDLLKTIARKTQVELRLHTESAVLADADAGQIEQVLTNLLMNAVQAMPRGGSVDLTIARAAATPPVDHGGPPGEFARVSVRDQGTGISPENLPHVFEPFFTTKDVGEGTGLGLSVTYGIIRDHGGWLEVKSEVGRGAEFTFFLPIAEAS